MVLLLGAGCATTQTDLNDADAYLKRGLAYHRKGHYDQAISDYTPGPLGNIPDNFQLEPKNGLKAMYDHARDENNGEDGYENCREGVWDPQAMLADSNFIFASPRSFPQTHMGVFLGGNDNSSAPSHARLWFGGYQGVNRYYSPLSAKTLNIYQGYGDPGDPDPDCTYQEGLPCSHWDPSLFPTAETVNYLPELSRTGHNTSATLEGATTLFNWMMAHENW